MYWKPLGSNNMDPYNPLDPTTIIKELLEALELEYGEGTCDCPHEPYNKHIVCPQCKARLYLENQKEGWPKKD